MPTFPKTLGREVPICLTIAGSDSGGGAGIQADLKTFSALGVYGASAITALTAQNTKTVTAVFEVPPNILAAQLQAVFDDLAVNSAKIGMLASAQLVNVVARSLQGIQCPVVLDPVMIAKSGDPLLQPDAIQALRELLPQVTLVTPNLPEAGRLLDCAEASNELEVMRQGKALLELGVPAVLMKGGHASGDICVDILVARNAEPVRLSSRRIYTKHTHGTGCTLSSAIAAYLAKGLNLSDACTEAHGYLHGALCAAEQLRIGSGRGPVHHFYRLWS